MLAVTDTVVDQIRANIKTAIADYFGTGGISVSIQSQGFDTANVGGTDDSGGLFVVWFFVFFVCVLL